MLWRPSPLVVSNGKTARLHGQVARANAITPEIVEDWAPEAMKSRPRLAMRALQPAVPHISAEQHSPLLAGLPNALACA
jgi:hypothetical protein